MINKICINSNTYHGYSLNDAMKGTSKAGFKYLELTAVRGWTEHVDALMSDKEIENVKSNLSSLGLSTISLSGHCDIMDDKRLDDFIKNIELAHKFDCKYIITSTGEAHFGSNENSGEDILVRNIKKCIPYCEKYGMTMTLEIHGKHGTGLQLKKIVERVGSSFLGINYDTANVIFYGGTTAEKDIKDCYEYVKYVHLKDKLGGEKEWNFPALGKGYVNIKEFCDFLLGKGYLGPMSIEIEFTDKGAKDLQEVDSSVKDSYDYLKSINLI